jgi:hypothetical protein
VSPTARVRVLVGSATALLFLGFALVLYTTRDERGPVSRTMLDAVYYHAYLDSLFKDGDLDFENEYRETGNYGNMVIYRETGRWGNVFGIGPPLFSLPLFGLGELAEEIFLGDVEKKPYAHVRSLAVKVTLLASPIYTALTLIFMFRLARRRLGGTWAPLLGGVFVILAGPAFYYACRQAGNSHPTAMFFTAWLLDYWDATYDRPRTMRTWLALGALFGATVLARPQLVLWGVAPLLTALDDARREGWRRALPRWAAAAGVAFVVFIPQLLAWKEIYGEYLVVPQGEGFMVWAAPRWSEVLFSTRNGLFAWSPLFAVATVGLLLSIRRAPRVALVLLAGFAGQIVTNGAVWDWWGGPSFGGRRFDSCFVAFAFGLAYLLGQRFRIVAALVGAIAALCAAATVRHALVTGVWTLMPPGGTPVNEPMRRGLPWWLADAYGVLSEVAIFPAKVAFALAHDAPLDAYERVVGAHFGTEVFPGVGGYPKPEQRVLLEGSEPFLLGFDATRRGARMRGERARILVPLNKRTGPVNLQLRLFSRVPVKATWNGRPLEVRRQGTFEPEVSLDPVERGVHDLDLEAPAGTILFELVFTIPPGTPP